MQISTPLNSDSGILSLDISWCELSSDIIIFSIMGRVSEDHLNWYLASVHGCCWGIYLLDQAVREEIDRWIRLGEVG